MQKVQRKPAGVRLSSIEKSYRENATNPKDEGILLTVFM